MEGKSYNMDLKEMSSNTSKCVDSAKDRDYKRVIVNVALGLRVAEAMELRGVSLSTREDMSHAGIE